MLRELFSCFHQPKRRVQDFADCKSDFGTYKPYRYPKSAFRRYHSSNITVRVAQKFQGPKGATKRANGPSAVSTFKRLSNLIGANERRKKIERQRRAEILKMHSRSGKGPMRTINGPNQVPIPVKPSRKHHRRVNRFGQRSSP